MESYTRSFDLFQEYVNAMRMHDTFYTNYTTESAHRTLKINKIIDV